MTGSAASAVAAVALAAAAGAAAGGRASAAALARLEVRPGPSRRRWVAALAGSVAVMSTAWLGTAAWLVCLGVLAAGAGARWQHGRRRTRGEAARRREVVGELLSALVAELRAGADPRAALVAAATGLQALEPLAGALAAVAARPSGDVPAALDALGGRPGGSTASDLAAAWRVADLTGCGLADPVARVLRGHRAEERLRREVAAQLAGPKATAALLSGLPLVGLALGIALGADPVGFLFGPATGRLVLVVGVALVAVGIVWSRRITAGALADFLAGPGESA